MEGIREEEFGIQRDSRRQQGRLLGFVGVDGRSSGEERTDLKDLYPQVASIANGLIRAHPVFEKLESRQVGRRRISFSEIPPF